MIFDKNFLKPNNNNSHHVYQEESGNADFVNPSDNGPYLISSLQKLSIKVICNKKREAIEDCLENYKGDTVQNAEINVVKSVDETNTTALFADFARSSYQKVLKDLENIQNLIDKLDMNEPYSLKFIS